MLELRAGLKPGERRLLNGEEEARYFSGFEERGESEGNLWTDDSSSDSASRPFRRSLYMTLREASTEIGS